MIVLILKKVAKYTAIQLMHCNTINVHTANYKMKKKKKNTHNVNLLVSIAYRSMLHDDFAEICSE